eukprot:1263999-Prymnesium_polylepis.1
MPADVQAAALAWCETEGTYDIDAIAALDAVDDFIDALRLEGCDASKVRNRLGGGETLSFPPDGLTTSKDATGAP